MINSNLTNSHIKINCTESSCTFSTGNSNCSNCTYDIYCDDKSECIDMPNCTHGNYGIAWYNTTNDNNMTCFNNET